jgi:hypothetical protein
MNAMPFWGPRQQVLPDYSLTTIEVYRDFTTQCILATNTLDFLSLVQDKTLQEIDELPSWVPDYSVSLEGRAAPLTWPENRRRQYAYSYCATKESEPIIKWSASDPNFLGVSGYCFDAILLLVDNHEGSVDGLLSQVKEWKSIVSILGSSSYLSEFDLPVPLIPSEKTLYQEEWIENLGMGGTKDFLPPLLEGMISWCWYISDLLQWFSKDGAEPVELVAKNWWCFFFFLICIKIQQRGATNDMEIEKVMEDAADEMKIWYEYFEYEVAIMAYIKGVVVGRRMAITEQGRIVHVPLSAEEGDALCLLKGGRVPYVLRRSEGDDGLWYHYQFVGEAFSWEDMHGGAVPKDLDAWHDMKLV